MNNDVIPEWFIEWLEKDKTKALEIEAYYLKNGAEYSANWHKGAADTFTIVLERLQTLNMARR